MERKYHPSNKLGVKHEMQVPDVFFSCKRMRNWQNIYLYIGKCFFFKNIADKSSPRLSLFPRVNT